MTLVVRIKFGSHLYGTNTPTSDLDYRSVHIPSADEILLQRVRASVVTGGRNKSDGEKNAPGDIDDESFSLQRFFELVEKGETGPLDMLFAPTLCTELTSVLWEHIVSNRSRLLCKRSAAFVGYCRTQANKYGIKGSRVAAAKVASEFFAEMQAVLGPTEKLGNLDESALRALCTDEHTQIVVAETTNLHFETFFECCNRKVAFGNTVKAAAEIFARIYENYGARAKLAAQSEGIDWKALSHAVRVGYEAIELLTTGHITFPLPNAQHVLEIKQGLLAYQPVAEEIEHLLEAVESASQVSTLPEVADKAWIDETVWAAHSRQITRSRE